MNERQNARHAVSGPAPREPRYGWLHLTLVICCGLLLFLGVIVALSYQKTFKDRNSPHPTNLGELLALVPDRIGEIPVEKINLLCATALCPTNEPDLKRCEAILETWAARVRSETERHRYRFERHPAEFENSPGFFRMLMLCVVLSEDFGVHYDLERRAGPAAAGAADGFFADVGSVFLHGLLGSERKGTCSSLPVLYVAVGRQLGYPLKLVTTRGHLFLRWEGQGERFNVEATARGLSRFDDDYYRHWPFELDAGEEASEGYLKSLTPPEELAVFLSIRGVCLREQGRIPEAIQSFTAAAKLVPGCRSYCTMRDSLIILKRGPKTEELTLQSSRQSVPN